jgi:4-amino-4-deoxy-L-arabinose transferase-like glycosyltransferase
MENAFRPLLLSLLATAIVAFAALGRAPLWDRDEPRNARCAAEMLQRSDWVVPTFNGQLRTHKPILLYWLMLGSYQLFGVHEWSARLPSALAGMLSVACTFAIARRFLASTVAAWSATALGTMVMMTVATRAATPDAWLIASITFAMALWTHGAWHPVGPCTHDGFRSVAYRTPTIGRWAAVWGACGLAVLAKGPVGILLPLAIIGLCTWWAIDGDTGLRLQGWRLARAAWSMQPLVALLAVLAVAGPWYVLVGIRTDGQWLRGFFFEHNMQRAMAPMEGHRGPGPLFYAGSLLVGSFPWSVFAAPIFIDAIQLYRRRRETRPMLILVAAWVGTFVAAFSLAATKLPSYVSPTYPGLALLIGFWLHRVCSGQIAQPRWITAALLVGMLSGVAIAIGAGVLAQTSMAALRPMSIAGIVLTVGSLLALAFHRRGQSGLAIRSYATASWMTIVVAFAAGPWLLSQQRLDLAALVTLFDAEPSRDYVAFGGGEPSWVFYGQRSIPEISAQSIDQAADHLARGQRVIARQALGESLIEHCRQQGIATHRVAQAPVFLEDDQLMVIERR